MENGQEKETGQKTNSVKDSQGAHGFCQYTKCLYLLEEVPTKLSSRKFPFEQMSTDGFNLVDQDVHYCMFAQFVRCVIGFF